VARQRMWRYYRTKAGNDVVRDELAAIDISAQASIKHAMARHRRGELLRYEEEHIGGDLHAIRVFYDKNTYRVLYAYEGEHDSILLALHVVHKKDQKLPKAARRLAEQRLKDWRR
jgi:phage-related protein